MEDVLAVLAEENVSGRMPSAAGCGRGQGWQKRHGLKSHLEGSRGCLPEASQTVYGSVRTAVTSEEQDSGVQSEGTPGSPLF